MTAENDSKKAAKLEQAAILFAEGDRTFAEIAKAVGCGDRTIYRWQSDPAFKARVSELRAANRERTDGEGIRRKDNRLARLQDLSERMQTIITERGAEMGLSGVFTDENGTKYELSEIPGGKSGLLARSYDKMGIAVYKFDAALVRELRETLKQAAIETGQWTEKQEIDLGEVKVIHVPAKLSQADWSAQGWEQPEQLSE